MRYETHEFSSIDTFTKACGMDYECDFYKNVVECINEKICNEDVDSYGADFDYDNDDDDCEYNIYGFNYNFSHYFNCIIGKNDKVTVVILVNKTNNSIKLILTDMYTKKKPVWY